MPTPVSESVPDHHHPEGEGDFFAQPTHHAHVLLVVHRSDDRAGAEEKQRFKKGVGKQVENARGCSRRPPSPTNM